MKTKKLYLSCTSIKTYLLCKKKYKYKHIDKIHTTEPLATKYMSFGNSIHLALAHFNMLTNPEYRTLAILHKLFRKNWIREGYASVEEEREFGLRGLEMLKNYYDDPLDQSVKNLVIEEMIYKDVGNYVLCGKLDKGYVRKDDEAVEVLDYKTAESISPIDPIQLPLYLILFHERLGYYPNAVSLYYLSKNQKLTDNLTDELVTKITNDIFDLCETICRQKEFAANPNCHCKTSCEYYNICKDAKDNQLMVLNSLYKFEENNQIETLF